MYLKILILLVPKNGLWNKNFASLTKFIMISRSGFRISYSIHFLQQSGFFLEQHISMKFIHVHQSIYRDMERKTQRTDFYLVDREKGVL